MDGTFFITLDYLKQLGACRDGLREFQRVFPDGGKYQDVLDRCAEESRVDFGIWLLNHIGATDDVRIYKEDINNPNRVIIFAGNIKFESKVNIKALYSARGIKASWGIEAGCGIKAGDGIEAGCGIKAGWGIEAGWGIKAGRGIEAGWGIKAGCGIEAGWGIKAGRGIEAGWGIKAGCGIEAGKDFCIFAGIKVMKSRWKFDAVVTAKSKPDNLVSGYWKPMEDSSEEETKL